MVFRLLKRDNEDEKRSFVRECVYLGHVKPEDEEKTVQELLNMDIKIQRM